MHSVNAQLHDNEVKCVPFPLFLSLVSFTSHVQILNRTHSMEEKIFYILYAARERLNSRDLVRAFVAQTYDAVMSKENLTGFKGSLSRSGLSSERQGAC